MCSETPLPRGQAPAEMKDATRGEKGKELGMRWFHHCERRGFAGDRGEGGTPFAPPLALLGFGGGLAAVCARFGSLDLSTAWSQRMMIA